MANYRQLAGSPPVLGASAACASCSFRQTDSPLYQNQIQLFSEEGASVYAAATDTNIDTGVTWRQAIGYTTPTAANPNTTITTCPDNNSYYYGDYYSGTQTQGALLVMVDLFMGASTVQSGHGYTVRFQHRATSADPWTDAVGMNGQTFNSTSTWQGYGGSWISNVGGDGWRQNGAYDVSGGGYGGAGTVSIGRYGSTQATQTYLFAFDQVGDFRIIGNKFQGTNGQCGDPYNDRLNFELVMDFDSLYDGTNTLYDYYVSSSPSGSSTSDTTKYYMAYEPYGKFVKQFYEYDSQGELVAAPLSGGHYWKRLSGVVNPSILNPESTNNGQYSGNLLVGTTGAITGYSTITLPG